MKQLHVFTIFSTPKSFFDGQFKYLVEHGNEIILACSDADDKEAFIKLNGIRFVPVEIPRKLSPLAILRAIKQICAIIRQDKPDVVFGHTPVGALVAMIAARICGVKNRIYYRHGLIYTTMSGLKRFVFKLEEKFTAALATGIINVSQSLSRLAMKDDLNSNGKQYVIGHGTCGGIDTQGLFNPSLIDQTKLKEIRKNLELGDADIVFGFCGRICNDKGIPELVEGFELFQKSHLELKAKLLFIGAFDVRDGVSESCKNQIKLNPDIVLSGHVEKRDIPYYYSLLDCFVFPSHREGFGMCVIEASAMCVPILDSKAHGCEDAIVEHVTGEYIDLTTESICTGMTSMLDAEKRKLLGQNGRRTVQNWYDSKVMWPLVNDLYSKILK